MTIDSIAGSNLSLIHCQQMLSKKNWMKTFLRKLGASPTRYLDRDVTRFIIIIQATGIIPYHQHKKIFRVRFSLLQLFSSQLPQAIGQMMMLIDFNFF